MRGVSVFQGVIMTKWNKEKLLERFKELHKDVYSYKDFNYEGTRQRIDIVCDKHGVFNQQIRKHLEGQGCKRCAAIKAKAKWDNPTGYREGCGKQVQYREYTVWRAMKQRTQPSYWKKCNHYTGTTCSDLFSTWDSYKGWYDSQFNSTFVDDEGRPFELDKDLLSNGGRNYSEDTCCFLPRLINVAVRNKSKNLGKLIEQYKQDLTKEAYEALLEFEKTIP